MREFIKVFEKDSFGDKATSIIKQECSRKILEVAEKMVAKLIRKRSKSNLSNSDIMSLRSYSAISKGSKSLSRSIYSSFAGTKWGMGGAMDDEKLKKMDIKPSI
jgi:hypothetical protein